MNTENITLITAVGGAVFGLLGATLGVFNTVRTVSRDKIKLRVIPGICKIEDGQYWVMSYFDDSYEKSEKWKKMRLTSNQLCIQVINDSTVPVTISQVGFETDLEDGLVTAIVSQPEGHPYKLPSRLEPLETAFFFGPETETIATKIPHITKAYCRTACDRKFYGTSPALRELKLRMSPLFLPASKGLRRPLAR